MIIKSPAVSGIPELKALWKEAFGDDDGFINAFFSLGFSQKRALCALDDGRLAGALYWFDMVYKNEKVAYIYGVATKKDFRGKGIGTAMMKTAEETLKKQGYGAITLVPAEKGVFHFYERLGYKVCAYIDDIRIASSANKTKLQKVGASEYFDVRKKHTDKYAPALCKEGFDFLDFLLDFYIGEDFISAIRKRTNSFSAVEFLGNFKKCAKFMSALGYKNGSARIKGSSTPFAMYLPLSNSAREPFNYLGFAFD